MFGIGSIDECSGRSRRGQRDFERDLYVDFIFSRLIGTDETFHAVIDPTCNQSRRCARACRCSNRNSGIHRLSDLYLDPLIDSKNEVHNF